MRERTLNALTQPISKRTFVRSEQDRVGAENCRVSSMIRVLRLMKTRCIRYTHIHTHTRINTELIKTSCIMYTHISCILAWCQYEKERWLPNQKGDPALHSKRKLARRGGIRLKHTHTPHTPSALTLLAKPQICMHEDLPQTYIHESPARNHH